MKIAHTILLVTLIACNDNASSDKVEPIPDTTLAEKKEAAPAEACYAKMEKDTIQLRIAMNDSSVTGSLIYKIYEKDSNKGRIEGTMHGDTLIANYTFQSEGTESVRKVAFLIKDGSATEGFGEPYSFGKSIVLKQTPCGDISN